MVMVMETTDMDWTKMTAYDAELEAIRSKPIVELTKAEFARLSEQDQRYVVAFLALPPVKWPY